LPYDPWLQIMKPLRARRPSQPLVCKNTQPTPSEERSFDNTTSRAQPPIPPVSDQRAPTREGGSELPALGNPPAPRPQPEPFTEPIPLEELPDWMRDFVSRPGWL